MAKKKLKFFWHGLRVLPFRGGGLPGYLVWKHMVATLAAFNFLCYIVLQGVPVPNTTDNTGIGRL